MALISIIVAVASNNIIGKDNKIPWYIPEDLEWFKSNTLGKPIIMGRKTHESIGKKLPGRLNIVISRDCNYKPLNSQVKAYTSLQEAINVHSSVDELVIIGGEQLYKEALPITNKIYFTRILSAFDGDTCFPELDSCEWNTTHIKMAMYYNLTYEFSVMERK